MITKFLKTSVVYSNLHSRSKLKGLNPFCALCHTSLYGVPNQANTISYGIEFSLFSQRFTQMF